MNETNKKRLKVTGSATLAAALLITGSLAWRDVSQHKTNKFKTKSVSQSMVLVESFKEKTDWKPNETVAKQVYVRNGQDTDDTNEYIYSDGYVRLQIREFLGKSTPKITWSEYRYLIDTKGDHVKGTSKTAAETAAKAIWADQASYTIEQVATPMDKGNGAPTGGYWYVRTNENAPNGIYGKFIMIKNEPGQLVSYLDETKTVDMDVLDKDQGDADQGQTGNVAGHNNGNALVGNEEDKDTYYTTHSWKTSNAIVNAIELNLGSEVKKLSTWDGVPGKYWILDDESESGWVYWGERLNHNKVGSTTNNSITHNFLESVTLKDTSDSLVYRLHINMDAVSFGDMSKASPSGWGTPGTDFPQEIKDAYESQEVIVTVDKTTLKAAIDTAEALTQADYTPATWTALQTALTNAKKVNLDPNSTQAQVYAQVTALNNAINALVKKPNKTGLAAAIATAEGKNQAEFTSTSWTALQTALTDAKAVNTNVNANQTEVDAAHSALNNAIDALVRVGYNVGDKFTKAGINWTVIAKQGAEHMIIADTLTKKHMDAMSIDSDEGKVGFNSASNLNSTYSGSDLSNLDEKFYKHYIVGSELEQYVSAVTFKHEPLLNTKTENVQRKDAYTVISDLLGVKTAFSLSISDLNQYKIDYTTLTNRDMSTWTRTPLSKEENGSIAASLLVEGGIGGAQVNLKYYVRPTMWVNFTK